MGRISIEKTQQRDIVGISTKLEKNAGDQQEIPNKGKVTEVKRVHKIPIPSNYRNAAKYVQIAVEEKRNVQPLLEQDKHFRAGRTIVGRVLSNMPIIDAIYNQLNLATKEPRIKQWLAKVMISELLFGSGRLVGNSRPVECMKGYERQLHMLLAEMKGKNMPAIKIKEPRFVRINTNLLNVEDAKRLLAEEQWILVDENFTDYRSFLKRVKKLGNYEYMEDFHFPDMLVFPHTAKWYWARAQHLRDKFLLQNKACLIPTYLLNPSKKSVVLDMCSAPGLKTTHLACLMKNKGRIYAIEHDATRYSVLCKFVSSYGVIKTIHSDCLKVTDEQVPGVQYILLDPSCSGSGMLQRQLVPEQVDEHRLYKLAGLQYKLLMHAMNEFPNVRRIVYSTCSVHVQENEDVVQGVLRHNSHFRLLDARKELGKEWLNVGSPKYPGIGERCLYAKTVDDLTIGMFVAVFERCPEGFQNETYLAYEKQKNSYERLTLKMLHVRNEHDVVEGQIEEKKETIEEHTVKETNEQEAVQEEVQLEKPTVQENVKQKSKSKKRKNICIEENIVEKKHDQEKAKEKSSSKKRKKLQIS